VRVPRIPLALATALALVLVFSACSQEDNLEEALSGNLPGGPAVGCTLQDDEDWYWCGAESDPGSGFNGTYRVEVADDCWTARRMEVRRPGKYSLRAQTYEGCFDDPNNGRSAFDEPGQFADGD
jgi:hypothetical protein